MLPSENGSGSESESDVREHRDRPRRQQPSPSLPPSSERAPPAPIINLQLIACRVCQGKSSFAHCLRFAKARTGERHVPRLRVVKGHTHRNRSKAVLLPGQREPPADAAAAEDGSAEDLPLTAENLALR